MKPRRDRQDAPLAPVVNIQPLVPLFVPVVSVANMERPLLPQVVPTVRQAITNPRREQQLVLVAWKARLNQLLASPAVRPVSQATIRSCLL